MRRDSSFCAKSVRYNVFTNGAPYSFAVYECMGRKIEVHETADKDFNFAKQFLCPLSKWRPWHVPYPRYATEINVTQSFTGHGISGKFFQ